MNNPYLMTDWEFFHGYFEIIDIYKDLRKHAQDKEIKRSKKDEEEKEPVRDFESEILAKKAEFTSKHELAKANGCVFFYDRISTGAGLDVNESLIIVFLLHHRTLSDRSKKVPIAELMKTIFPKRQEHLERLYCLSPQGRLVRFGLIKLNDDTVEISESFYLKFLEIGQEPRVTTKVEGWKDRALTYSDYLEVSYFLCDLMWERADIISVLMRSADDKLALHDLKDINQRIESIRTELEAMTTSSIANEFPIVRLSNQYQLGFEERMMIVSFMQRAFGLENEEHNEEGYLKILDLCRFVSSSVYEVVPNLRLFGENAPLIKEEILENYYWWRTEPLQDRKLQLAAGILDLLLVDTKGNFQEMLDELGAKLRTNSQPSPVLNPRFTLDDVVLEKSSKDSLLSCVSQFQNRDLIFNQWGFGDVIKYGTSVTMLFAGPPGTGKTMAAEALAGHLGKKIIIVDYSKLENKYVGETEKNIAKCFRLATEKDAVLVFDEADAVFYDRSIAQRSWEVREVNVLLQEMERFKGILVLTTNRHDSFDPALERRLSLRLLFNPPEANERVLLWKKHFPSKAPLAEDINFNTLAFEYALTGAQIKNVALSAARKASLRVSQASGTVITKEDIKSAITDEKTLCWSGTAKGPIGFRP